ncbi:hypothetical protein M408DRAFT_8310 [Serendipita vermifera MAFF 305830]|uniref:Uncharacterized protein n=1 Tax=Serendipita vermifera MAFF 305830 TaxID=933852 RepID=A0A0C3BCS2_SERVB|nr:hypothetical protein M408DRAFT_8310 [Serendipita vermifera MAFF 305830]
MSNDGVESRIKIDKFPENALDEKVKSATRLDHSSNTSVPDISGKRSICLGLNDVFASARKHQRLRSAVVYRNVKAGFASGNLAGHAVAHARRRGVGAANAECRHPTNPFDDPRSNPFQNDRETTHADFDNNRVSFGSRQYDCASKRGKTLLGRSDDRCDCAFNFEWEVVHELSWFGVLIGGLVQIASRSWVGLVHLCAYHRAGGSPVREKW